jgi:hypothetical protein
MNLETKTSQDPLEVIYNAIVQSRVDRRRRRRGREEVEELVQEFGSSGMKRSEFCRLKGLALNPFQPLSNSRKP